ncbi:hypothetical protein HK405_015715, partial [Cladochytrium tenue]
MRLGGGRFSRLIEAAESAAAIADTPLSTFYEVKLDALPPKLAFGFVPLAEDDAVRDFMRVIGRRTIFGILLARILMFFMAFTDAISYAGMNCMHVLSTTQASTLLAHARKRCRWIQKVQAAGGISDRDLPGIAADACELASLEKAEGTTKKDG